MKDEPVVCGGNDACGEMFDQFLFYGQGGGVFVGDEAYAMAYAEDVCIDGHGIAPPHDGLHHVGRLATYTG